MAVKYDGIRSVLLLYSVSPESAVLNASLPAASNARIQPFCCCPNAWAATLKRKSCTADNLRAAGKSSSGTKQSTANSSGLIPKKMVLLQGMQRVFCTLAASAVISVCACRPVMFCVAAWHRRLTRKTPIATSRRLLHTSAGTCSGRFLVGVSCCKHQAGKEDPVPSATYSVNRVVQVTDITSTFFSNVVRTSSTQVKRGLNS